MAELSEYVTASMVAQEAGINYTTILSRIHRNDIPVQRLGKIITIKREHVALVTLPLYKRGTSK